jgi:protein tyrosine/serine phosphatase
MQIVNFRDFGGLPVAGGGHVTSGALFRCGQPGSLGTTPFEALVALDFSAVADLRFPDEIRSAIFPWSDPAQPTRILMEEAGRGDAPHHAFFTAPLETIDDVHRLYASFYAGLPLDPRYQSLIRRAFHAFSAAEGPVLIHCSAGKDRTGFIAALLLRLLGAREDDIVADYMISDSTAAKAALRPEIERRFAAHGRTLPRGDILDAILGVSPAYLESSFAAIANQAGSIPAYLDAIGIDSSICTGLRTRFLA